MVSLMQDEWLNLFPFPQFDAPLVNKMLLKNRPGDFMNAHKRLFIKVLHEEQTIAAFITYFFSDAHTIHIELLATSKKFRGKGYGKKLIEYVVNSLSDQHYTSIELYVYTTNSSAIGFYKHLGFTIKQAQAGGLILGKEISPSTKTVEATEYCLPNPYELALA